MNLIVNNEDDLVPIALQLLEKYPNQRVFTFSGDLGSGKTTFIKYLCMTLGAKGQVSSPTFSIVNEYESEKVGKIYHFDFYRIKKMDEVYDIGYEEYFYSGKYCFIEWPELIEKIVPPNAVKVKIEELIGSRKFTVTNI